MAKVVEAIYEDGVLRPLEKLEIEEHKKVRITILEQAKASKVSENPIDNILHYIKNPFLCSIDEVVMASDPEID